METRKKGTKARVTGMNFIQSSLAKPWVEWGGKGGHKNMSAQ